MLPLLTEYKEKLLRDGLSPVTIENRYRGLIYFAKYLGHEEMGKVSAATIEKYKVYLMTEPLTKDGRKLKDGTILVKLLALPPYFKFLEESRKIFFDPTLNMEFPKRIRRLPDYIPNAKDIEDLLQKPDTRIPTGIRDKAILELMYTCPLRNKEVISLTMHMIDMKNKYIFPVRVKSGRECGIPMMAMAYRALCSYLTKARPVFAARSKVPVDRIFLTERGEAFKRFTLAEILAKYDKRIHPHSIRHACAVHMLKNGAGVRDIQVLLGHRSLTSTQAYTKLTAHDLRDMHARFHPREKYARKELCRQ